MMTKLPVGGLLMGLAAAAASVGPASAADPIRLTDAQMDRVSAAGALAGIGLEALAFGDDTFTSTSSSAEATSVSASVDIATAVGTASAYACCGDDAMVLVAVDVGGIGDMVASLVTAIGRGLDDVTTGHARGAVWVVDWHR